MEEVKSRSEIPEEFKWDLERIYKDEAAYDSDFGKLEGLISELESYKGRLHESPAVLAQAFAVKYRLSLLLSKLATYATRRADEDLGNSRSRERSDKLDAAEAGICGRLSWFQPEILAMDAAALEEFQRSPALAEYARPLALIVRDKPHTLSPSEERLLALLDEPLSCAQKAYRVLLNVDSHFGSVDVEGKPVQFSRGNYSNMIRHPDRKVRLDAYTTLYAEQQHYINTYAALLDGKVRADVFSAKASKFPSAIAAALHPDAVQVPVYDALIAAVHAALPSFYRYITLRKRCLGIAADKLGVYDLYVPLVKSVKVDVPFDKAVRWMFEAVKPLGAEYAGILKKCIDERCIDRYENKGKRSGAYSSGYYGGLPYILLNHSDDLKSAFTLVHECGHSMHTFLSNRAQPYHLARYRIFVAEIASIVNERLLQHYLLQHLESELSSDGSDGSNNTTTTTTTSSSSVPSAKDVRVYLLNNLCDDFRGTVFRQTMFAEFEKIIHERVEKGDALSTDALCEIYRGLNRLYLGEEVDSDDLIATEWSRIPHFYYNFYVYKYATSFCVAQKVSAAIINGVPGAVENYIKFLSSGCTKDPMDLIRDYLGIDLTDPKVVQDSLDVFGKTVDELEKELIN